MDDMDGDGEVKDEFRAHNDYEDEYHTDQAIQQPYQCQHPSNRCVTADSLPAEQQVQRKPLSRNQNREHDQYDRRDIICELEESYPPQYP